MKKLNLLWLILPILVLVSCDNNPYKEQTYETPADQAQIDQNALISHLIENKVDAERTESGIYYTIEKEGEGVNPVATDRVKVHYRGTTLDGTQFDSSYDRGEPIEFSLQGVIPGWTEGVQLLKEGGKGTLYIPSGLAYGAKGAGANIAPNSPLKFEIELIDVITKEELEVKYQEALRAYITEGQKKHGAADDAALEAYIKKNNLKAEKTPEGIYYIIEEAGSEEKPLIAGNVTCHYEGTLLDGTKFDSSYDRGQPATFPLTQVIPGWSLGIPLFGKGGKGTLLIPSHLAYGEQGSGDKIKPNSCLKFDVEIIDFK